MKRTTNHIKEHKAYIKILAILVILLGVTNIKAATIEPENMSIFNLFKSDPGDVLGLSLYSDKELDKVDTYISEHFGKFENVFHEFASDVIHVDICVIPPTEERNYITLVTMGMGAKKMNVPWDLKDQPRTRAELLICLPPDWPLTKDSLKEEKWYWPIRLLEKLAHLPFDEDNWLGEGHSIEYGETFDKSTLQSAALLVNPYLSKRYQCFLTKRKVVNFYQVIPLYREEMFFKQKNGADELLKFFSKDNLIVDPNRKCVIF